MIPAKHFFVHIGAPALADHLPEGPVLVVDADQERLDRLDAELEHRQHPFACVTRCAVLTAEPQTALQWFSYSDRRFDGVLAPEAWSDLAANLTCLMQQTLVGCTLATLLDGAGLPLEEHQTGCLLIDQGDPVAAVAGAGEWLDHIMRVDLRHPDARGHWGTVMDSQLESLGFRPQTDRVMWQRPAALMMKMLLERIQRQRQDLVLERDEQLEGRRQLAEQLESASLQHREQMQREREEIQREREEVQRERERSAERESAMNASRNVLIQERDQLKQHIEAVQRSHEEALAALADQHRRELDLLQQRWDRRESEISLQALQQEALVQASSAQVGLITDLMAKWGMPSEQR